MSRFLALTSAGTSGDQYPVLVNLDHVQEAIPVAGGTRLTIAGAVDLRYRTVTMPYDEFVHEALDTAEPWSPIDDARPAPEPDTDKLYEINDAISAIDWSSVAENVSGDEFSERLNDATHAVWHALVNGR